MSEEDYKIAYENVMIANKMLEKENKRLNNIINEIEDLIVIKLQRNYHEFDYRIDTGDLEEIYDRLKNSKEVIKSEYRRSKIIFRAYFKRRF